MKKDRERQKCNYSEEEILGTPAACGMRLTGLQETMEHRSIREMKQEVQRHTFEYMIQEKCF